MPRSRIHSRHGTDRSRPSGLLPSTEYVTRTTQPPEGNGQCCLVISAWQSFPRQPLGTFNEQRSLSSRAHWGQHPCAYRRTEKESILLSSSVMADYQSIHSKRGSHRTGGLPTPTSTNSTHLTTQPLSSLGHRGGLFPLSRARAATHYPQAPFGWD